MSFYQLKRSGNLFGHVVQLLFFYEDVGAKLLIYNFGFFGAIALPSNVPAIRTMKVPTTPASKVETYESPRTAIV